MASTCAWPRARTSTSWPTRPARRPTLSVPGDPDAVTIDFVLSGASVASVARVGRPSIAHATATGKVMLAFASDEAPAAPLARYTEHTITDPGRLADEVAAVRRDGHAHASREREPDLNAVAVPVFGEPGELIAILGVQAPDSRFRVRAQDRGGAAPSLPCARALGRARVCCGVKWQ